MLAPFYKVPLFLVPNNLYLSHFVSKAEFIPGIA